MHFNRIPNDMTIDLPVVEILLIVDLISGPLHVADSVEAKTLAAQYKHISMHSGIAAIIVKILTSSMGLHDTLCDDRNDIVSNVTVANVKTSYVIDFIDLYIQIYVLYS